MLTAQFTKVIYDVWGNRTRSLLIILSIAVGLLALGTVLNASSLLSQATEASYVAINYADGLMITGQPLDKKMVRSFSNIDGIGEVDARRALAVRAINQSGGYTNLQMFSVVDYEDMRVNLVSPVAGKWPPSSYEMLIDNASLSVLGANIGDVITIEAYNGAKRSLPIKGTVKDLSLPPAAMVGAAYAYVDQETMEWLGGDAGFNQVYITPDNQDASNAEIESVLDRLADKAEFAGYTVVSNKVVEKLPISNVINTLLFVLAVISGLSLFLSVFLIINTISAMITQQMRQIGVMKAIGGRVRQILWMYLSVVLIYSLVALSIAVPLSILAGDQLSRFLTGIFGFTARSSPVQPTNILILIGVGFFVPCMASLLPLVTGLRISATQALNSEGINRGNYGANFIDRLLSGANIWGTRNLILRPVVLSVRNMLRHKLRLILTLATLVIAGAVFITLFNLRAATFTSMGEMTQMQSSYDLQVDFAYPYRFEKIKQEMTTLPEVQEIDSWLTIQAERIRPNAVEGDDISIIALPASSTVISSPKILTGRWLVPGDENALVISSAYSKDEPELQVGQDMQLKINDRVYTYHIVGKSMDTSLEVNTVYVNYPYTAKLVHNGDRFSTYQVQMKPDAGISPVDFQKQLEQQLQTDGYQVASIQTTTTMSDNIQDQFGSILILLMLMALLLTMVGGFGLMGTMSINVLERTREIGVLRAIGASNRGVNKVFMLEGLSIGLISCLFAIPLSFPITNLMTASIGMLATSTPWKGTYTASGFVIWIATVIVLSLLANYLPARNASRLTVREVLAYE